MKDKQFAVLQAMSTIEHSTDMEEFLRLVGLTSAEFLETLKELAHEDLVAKTGKGYAISEKGKQALAILLPVPEETAFRFYFGLGDPAGFSTRSVKEFYDVVKIIDPVSLEFHLERQDFENWFKTAVKDDAFAGVLAGVRQMGFRGESLKQQILLSLQTLYGEDLLNRNWST